MRVAVPPGFEPLEDDQEVHVTEDEDQENQLRNGFEPKLHFSSVVQRIGTLDEDSQSHVHHSDDDRDLHLETVDVIEIVLGH